MPVVVAAVELAEEQMVVLGQVSPGWTVDDLEVGMAVKLELGVLYTDGEIEYMTWQWRPVDGFPNGETGVEA